MTSSRFLDSLRAVVGPAHVLTADLDSYSEDWRGQYRGRAFAVVRPADTAEVQAVVRLCAGARVAIVPQGGNTSLCGASVPDGSGTQIVLSLSRMNRVLEVDARNDTMTVQAGCVLQMLQDTARSVERLFPLSLGAEGSCQIGGNIATNAGGVQVLRYGNTRDLVLGLEVVLADGDRLDVLRGLRKDNTGYDLKQCFIGAEGTLGIITAATLKLFPMPAASSVAFAGLNALDDAVSLLHALRAQMGDRFTAFELMSSATLDMVRRHFPDTRLPLDTSCDWYVLIEAADSGDQIVLDEIFQAALGQAIDDGRLIDVAIAASHVQAAALWEIRERVSEAQQRDGANIKHDIAVAVSALPALVCELLPRLATAFPGCRPLVYGHLGDGNLHFNVAAPASASAAEWGRQTRGVNALVHDAVVRLGGSISAEHGIGQLKRHEMTAYKSRVELAVMWRIKHALDPLGLLNPGKVLPDEGVEDAPSAREGSAVPIAGT